MSMKIWNGLKFKTNNPEELISQLNALKKKAVENSRKYIIDGKGSALAVKAAGYTKDTVGDVDVENDSLLLDIREKIEQSFNKRYRSWKDPAFQFSVVVIPYHNELYGISYHEDIDENLELLSPLVEEYHYQDQTDKPDEISDEEWDARSEVWNDVFDKYVSPSDAGFIYEIVKSDDLDFDTVKTIFKNYAAKFADGWTIDCCPIEKDIKSDSFKRFKEINFKSEIAEMDNVHIACDWRNVLSTEAISIKFATPSETDKNQLEELLTNNYSDVLTFKTEHSKVRKDWLGIND